MGLKKTRLVSDALASVGVMKNVSTEAVFENAVKSVEFIAPSGNWINRSSSGTPLVCKFCSKDRGSLLAAPTKTRCPRDKNSTALLKARSYSFRLISTAAATKCNHTRHHKMQVETKVAKGSTACSDPTTFPPTHVARTRTQPSIKHHT